MIKRRLKYAEWRAEGMKRFGQDEMKWRFRCPCCGHIATGEDYEAAGAPQNAIGFSCIGRWIGAKRQSLGGRGPGPCDYAGGGLFRLGPVEVEHLGDRVRMFEFA